MTTLHNLSEKYTKRLRQIAYFNGVISHLVTKSGPLTSGEKRSLSIAWRNLHRAMEDRDTVIEQINAFVEPRDETKTH